MDKNEYRIVGVVNGVIKAEAIIVMLKELGLDAVRLTVIDAEVCDRYSILVHRLGIPTENEHKAISKIVEAIDGWFKA